MGTTGRADADALQQSKAARDADIASADLAIEARHLVKRFGDTYAVKGVDLMVPRGTITGVLGPNGAGKTTTLRMLMGIIDPDEGERIVLGARNPHKVAEKIGYLPEERSLYPAMTVRDAIAFAGAIRGLPLREGRRRAEAMLDDYGLGATARRQVRTLSKGMAQTVQLLGAIVHRPELVVLDEPFSGLDALNQGRLERLIRALVADGTTILFSTHVIAHAERLCRDVAIIAGGEVRFAGPVDAARDILPARVRLRTHRPLAPLRGLLPGDATEVDGLWTFPLPDGGVEPLLRALLNAEVGLETLAIERPSLHDAFVAIAGAAVAKAMAQSALESEAGPVDGMGDIGGDAGGDIGGKGRIWGGVLRRGQGR